MSEDSEIGIVKWFNQEKKFGLVGGPNNEDYFLYYTNAINPETPFKKGMVVYFEMGYDEKRDKKMAFKLRPLKIIDYKAVVNLLDKDHILKQDKSSRRRYKSWVTSEGDIFISALAFLYKNVPVDKIARFITECLKYSEELGGNTKTSFTNSLGIFFRKIPDRFEKIPDESEEYGWRLEDRIKQILDGVKDKVNKSTIISLWIEGVYDLDNKRSRDDQESFINIPKELPFEPEELIQYADQLSAITIIDLYNYEVDSNIILEIVNSKYQSKQIREADLEDLERIFSTFKNISGKLYELIENKLSDELIFNTWKEKKYKISSSNRTISKPLLMRDYKIEESILFEFSDEVSIDEIERVSKLYDEKVLKNLLVNIFEGPNKLQKPGDKYFAIIKLEDDELRKEVQKSFINCCLENSIAFLLKKASSHFVNECIEIIHGFDQSEVEKNMDFFRQTIKQEGSDLDVENALIIFDGLEASALLEYYKTNIKNFTDEEKIKFIQASTNIEVQKLTLGYWNFNSTNLTERLLKIVDSNRIQESKSFKSTLVDRLEDHSVSGLIDLYQNTGLEFIKSEIFNRISFTTTHEIEKLVEVLDEADKELLLDLFDVANPNLGLYDFLKLLEIFSSHNISVQSEVINDRITSVRVDFINTLLSKIDLLLSVDKQATVEGLKKLIENKKEELPLLDFIDHVEIVEIAEKAFRYYQFDNNEKLVSLLTEREVLKKLPSSLMGKTLSRISSSFPYEVLKFASENYPAIIKKLTGSLVVDKTNIASVLKLIDESIVVHSDSKYRSDFFTLAKFFENYRDEESITNLNELLEEKNYSVQIILYKYLAYLYQNTKVDFATLKYLLNQIKTVQLSSLLVKSFIIESFENRNQLMDKMNRLLKEHFTLLRDQKLTQKSFDQIFSLYGLVKKCNGRKSFGGVNLWQGGNITRYYTDGDHYVMKGEVLDIYCEGRFWKKQQFYDSDTNKPTGKSCDLYWCKNDKCVGVNDTVDLSLPFEQWTLNELNEVFNKELDRLAFTYVAGWLNRMDTILHKLDCHSCGELLRPKNFVPNQLGYYAVPLFNCVNSSCENQGITIRFTHCRGCKKILDSRDCKTCDSCNWLICDSAECGKCGCGARHDPKYVEY